MREVLLYAYAQGVGANCFTWNINCSNVGNQTATGSSKPGDNPEGGSRPSEIIVRSPATIESKF